MFPPDTIDQLRPIASLLNFNKIQETAIAGMVIEDMENSLDPSQYGNRKQTSILPNPSQNLIKSASFKGSFRSSVK